VRFVELLEPTAERRTQAGEAVAGDGGGGADAGERGHGGQLLRDARLGEGEVQGGGGHGATLSERRRAGIRRGGEPSTLAV
jgi:hypothetical protein